MTKEEFNTLKVGDYVKLTDRAYDYSIGDDPGTVGKITDIFYADSGRSGAGADEKDHYIRTYDNSWYVTYRDIDKIPEKSLDAIGHEIALDNKFK